MSAYSVRLVQGWPFGECSNNSYVVIHLQLGAGGLVHDRLVDDFRGSHYTAIGGPDAGVGGQSVLPAVPRPSMLASGDENSPFTGSSQMRV